MADARTYELSRRAQQLLGPAAAVLEARLAASQETIRANTSGLARDTEIIERNRFRLAERLDDALARQRQLLAALQHDIAGHHLYARRFRAHVRRNMMRLRLTSARLILVLVWLRFRRPIITLLVLAGLAIAADRYWPQIVWGLSQARQWIARLLQSQGML